MNKKFVGTAGWSLPKEFQPQFVGDGSHLERYAKILNAVEINSSFYKEHKPETYEKWAASVGPDFRFSVKLSKYFLQEQRLKDVSTKLDEVVEGISHLGEKWGALLIQLPPSLDFDFRVTEKFLRKIKKLTSTDLVWEPRHRSWNSNKAVRLLEEFEVSRALADPDPVRLAREKVERLRKVIYLRLHGSPQIYKSAYSTEIIERVNTKMFDARASGKTAWCIFDNTTYGLATGNALELKSLG